ncbi:LacI family DNA-binding transcriptional regulator [Yinghuangia soli]|uniref:LacI family transcriptional regulator n=1 Tax=Yinghuangia soli TaxID=2908204 RepID=A0AA41U6M9_9ACTN|nr:LacI family DNA-binding transcriptional regulator [Yinghuangia soli]MCF2531119.1 LacI family transcriptional regulator [Yinghuangia soli]
MPEVAASRRVTSADIAKDVGVSRATVGFVLNSTPGKKISEATRARVLESAARLGYQPNRAAADLARGRSKIILLVLPDRLLGPSMQASLDEGARVLAEAGYALVTQPQARPLGGIPPLWETLGPDVVIGWTTFTPEEVMSMRAAGVRRIRPRPGESARYDQAPGVAEGARMQVDHLHELGHRRIAVAALNDPQMIELQRSRADAAMQRAEELGMETVALRSVDHRDGSSAEAVRIWHDDGVTAVVAYNDDVAATVAGAAIEAGLRVPQDLAVIGHDDSPIASLFVPPLSSIRMDTVEAARYLAAVALHEADGRPVTSTWTALDTRVVARRSTLG